MNPSQALTQDRHMTSAASVILETRKTPAATEKVVMNEVKPILCWSTSPF